MRAIAWLLGAAFGAALSWYVLRPFFNYVDEQIERMFPR